MLPLVEVLYGAADLGVRRGVHTAYLGGAVCAQVRVDAELFGFVLFPVYVAVLLLLRLYRRSAALRRLVRTGY